MALADSRRKILGAALMITRSKVGAVGLTVKLQEAAQGAGLTTGTAYKIWDNQDEFRQDLAEYALKEVAFSAPENLAAIAMSLMETDATQSEVLRVLGMVHYEEWLRDEDMPVIFALIGAAGRDDRLGRVVAETYLERGRTFAELYGSILARYQRRLRSPYSMQDLVSALSATTDGFLLRALFLPDLMGATIERTDGPSGEPRQWKLFACAVEGIVEHLTEPEGGC